jgi:hypothetical protein
MKKESVNSEIEISMIFLFFCLEGTMLQRLYMPLPSGCPGARFP